MKAEQQKNLVAGLIVAALVVGGWNLATRKDAPGSDVRSVSRQDRDRRTAYCVRNTGEQRVEGSYNQFNRCMDYLRLVSQRLIDPAKYAPPWSLASASTAPGPAAPAAPTTVPPTTTTVLDGTQCPPSITGDNVPRITSFKAIPPMCIDKAKKYTALFDTSEGVIEVALDVTKTPNTANNFVFLSRWKYYDDTRIFRTDLGLDIIQGGGMSNTSGPGYSILDEGAGYTYSPGDIAMARTAEPNSAGGQFFFVTGERGAVLNGQGTYVVFGKISKGLDVVKSIIALDNGQGAPGRDVVVRKVRIVES